VKWGLNAASILKIKLVKQLIYSGSTIRLPTLEMSQLITEKITQALCNIEIKLSLTIFSSGIFLLGCEVGT
jgi:hypothetical protein